MPSYKRNSFASKRRSIEPDADRIACAQSFRCTDLCRYVGLDGWAVFSQPDRPVSPEEQREFWEREQDGFRAWHDENGAGQWDSCAAHCIFAYDRVEGWRLMGEVQERYRRELEADEEGNK